MKARFLCEHWEKKRSQKRLLLRSRLLVHNSAPLEALFWCHLQRWSRFKQQEKVRNSSTFLRGAILAPLFFSVKYHYSNGAIKQEVELCTVTNIRVTLSLLTWNELSEVMEGNPAPRYYFPFEIFQVYSNREDINRENPCPRGCIIGK